MGYENFYQVIDRAVVDPLLALTWPEFLRRYKWRHGQRHDPAEYLEDFALDDEDDIENIPRILASRTLRWTMQRTAPQLHFLETIFESTPDIRNRCPTLYCGPIFAYKAMFLAAAVDGFFNERLTWWDLFVTCSLLGADDTFDYLDLDDLDRRGLQEVLHPMFVPSPVFPWLPREHDGQYYSLGLRETKSFLKFVQRAVAENWACPLIAKDTLAELPRAARKAPTMRDNEVATKLVRWLNRSRRFGKQRLCMVWEAS